LEITTIFLYYNTPDKIRNPDVLYHKSLFSIGFFMLYIEDGVIETLSIIGILQDQRFVWLLFKGIACPL
jgi:hypothetical protein